MDSMFRLKNIPIVERGLVKSNSIYQRIKLNQMFWGVQRIEDAVLTAADSIHPAIRLLQRPIQAVDHVLGRGIDFVEQTVPGIHLPPEMMYSSTKEYVTDRLVRPVLKRANSVKTMGNAVLESRVSSYAATRIDGALNAADKYVDRFLPQDGDVVDSPQKTDSSRPLQTFKRSQQLSRKLKRRLTQRTINEARALQKQSKEAIHVLIYAAELIVCDPKMAIQKAGQLWSYLSKDEPDNQARPHTLEQFAVMLSRETARKLVHITNFTASVIVHIPRKLLVTSSETTQRYIHFAFYALKLENLKAEAAIMIAVITQRYSTVENYTHEKLVKIALWIANRVESIAAEQQARPINRQGLQNGLHQPLQ